MIKSKESSRVPAWRRPPSGEGISLLFQKKIEPRCAYCRRSATVDEKTVICLKKGIVSAAGQCRSFRYDPLRRVPPKPAAPDFSRLDNEDFTL